MVADKIKDKKTKGFYLIILNYETRMLKFMSFEENEITIAREFYQSMETSDKMDSVLVSISDVKSLKNAYPNYFLDANLFINEVEKRSKK